MSVRRFPSQASGGTAVVTVDTGAGIISTIVLDGDGIAFITGLL
jgi:hypothetical protein